MKHYSAAAIEREIVTDGQLKERLRARLAGFPAVGGKARMAGELGISEGTLSRLLRGHLPIGPAIAEKLGYRRITRFERIS